jgi:hypothetical protein
MTGKNRKNKEWWLPVSHAVSQQTPGLLAELVLLKLVGRRRPAVAVPTESPAHRNGGIEAVRAGGAEVGWAKQAAVTSQIVDLVLGQAQLEISR